MPNVNQNNQNDEGYNIELEKSNVHIIVEILEYVPHAVVSKTILKKATGQICVSSFDAGEELQQKTSPFDVYIQIIDGTAVVGIKDKNYKLRLGEGIIIPAHTLHRFNASEQFKMVSTVIKSGYEDVEWLFQPKTWIWEMCNILFPKCNM